MTTTIADYRKAAAPLPETYHAWQLFGAGFEHVGRDGRPVELKLREPADNEILLRVDALGLCQSDIKIINQGNKHARLRGRDLASDPTVLGHECAATVVKAGRQWQDKFKPGERYIVQADIYYKGENYAFGYLIPGGLAGYCYLDERALEGDEGCYLLPVQQETGYSQSALAEPWACVEMSYNLHERRRPEGGALLIVEGPDAPDAASFPNAARVGRSLDDLPEGPFDDIIVPGPSPALVNALAPKLARHGIMYLLGKPEQDGAVALDVGRIHYENIRFLGGAASIDELEQVHARYDLKPGGAAVFIGAGGPMGQMHVHRAIEISNGPKLVVVTDLERSRLDHIKKRFGPMAKEKGITLRTFAPDEFESPDAMNAEIQSLPDAGYDDVVVMAPVAALVADALRFAADNAFVNVFAGVGIGTTADFRLGDLCRGVRMIGSSGSRISDLRKVLDMVESNQLETNLSVAAIAGLNAAREGLKGLAEVRYPGKTVVYTQIPDLPLMAIEEIPEKLPQLKDKLGPGGAWTVEAERALLEMFC